MYWLDRLWAGYSDCRHGRLRSFQFGNLIRVLKSHSNWPIGLDRPSHRHEQIGHQIRFSFFGVIICKWICGCWAYKTVNAKYNRYNEKNDYWERIGWNQQRRVRGGAGVAADHKIVKLHFACSKCLKVQIFSNVMVFYTQTKLRDSTKRGQNCSRSINEIFNEPLLIKTTRENSCSSLVQGIIVLRTNHF